MILACVLLVYTGGVLLFWLALSSLCADIESPTLPLLPTLLLVVLWPLALVVGVGLVAWDQYSAGRDSAW